MNIQSVNRPWIKKAFHSAKPSDSFYQSSTWKAIRNGFIQSPPLIKLPPINGFKYANRYCADCWKGGKINDERIEIHHLREISDDGDKLDFANMMALCHSHHTAVTNKNRQQRNKPQSA